MEFDTLLKQDVYNDFPHDTILPSNQLLTLGIVTKIKTDSEGKEVCLKACLVVHRNHQIAGLSYSNTFSNTPNLQYIHITLLIIAHTDLDCHMINVTSTYMHAPIDQPLYIQYPNGYSKGSPTVMKLKKALYGTHHSGHLWEQYCNAKVFTLSHSPHPPHKPQHLTCDPAPH